MSSKGLKVIHFRKNCIGCNSCVTIAPQTWVMDQREGKSRLIGSKLKGKAHVADLLECDLEANKKAAAACPVNIIHVSSPSS